MSSSRPENILAAESRLRNNLLAIESSSVLRPVEKVMVLSSLIMHSYHINAEPDIKFLVKEGYETIAQAIDSLHEAQLIKAESHAVQYVKEGAAHIVEADQLRSYFLTKYNRYSQIAALGDETSFLVLLEEAKKNLQLPYYDTRPGLFYALAEFAVLPDHRNTLISIYRKSLEEALQPGKENGYNAVLIPLLCNCLGLLEADIHSTYLYEVFSFTANLERNYAIIQASGDIAIVLANLQYKGELTAFHKFLKEFEWRYQEIDFLMKTRYALWMLTNDAEGALQYLGDPQKSAGKIYAATAVADLNEKRAIPNIQDLYSASENIIHREIYFESLQRLLRLIQKPLIADRMIHFFGVRTQLELAGGEETDNVFIMRAMEKTKQHLGIVTEADDE